MNKITWFHVFALTGSLLLGFFVGKIDLNPPPPIETVPLNSFSEMSLVLLERIQGDTLYATISGPVRIIWSGEKFVDTEGINSIPLGQIPHEDDLKYLNFPFVGNAKTGKFYPANTYWARGVGVKYRRFFENKESAVLAGFIPSKSIK